MPQNADKQIAGEKKSQDTMLDSLLHQARVPQLLYRVHGKHASLFENKKEGQKENQIVECMRNIATARAQEAKKPQGSMEDP
jgi:hypothetical protein